MQGGKQQLPRRAALGLYYTEGLNTAKPLSHYGAQRLFNHTRLTS